MFTSYDTRVSIIRCILVAAVAMAFGFAGQAVFAADSSVSLAHNKANAIQQIDAIDRAAPPQTGAVRRTNVPSDISLQHSKLPSTAHVDSVDAAFPERLAGREESVPSDISLQHSKLPSEEHVDLIDRGM